MKLIIKGIALGGIALAIYSAIGRFIGGATIGYGIISFQASTGLLVSNTLILIAILLKLNK